MEDNTEIKECECDANLFYKKYKDKIEVIFTDVFGIGDSIVQLDSVQHSTSRFAKGEGDRGSIDKMVKQHLAEQDLDYSKGGQLVHKESRNRGGRREDGYYPFGHGFRTNAESENQYEDSLGVYQKLFDHHLNDLYGVSEGGAYFKSPRQSQRESEIEDDEGLNFPYKDTSPWMSESQRKAENYLRMHKIHELFQFLGSHLCASQPDNPIDFLVTLLDMCLKYRCGFMEPPLLFTFKHIESVFKSMDPMSIGVIDLEQYYTGMQTLGVRYSNDFPTLNQNGYVKKNIFILQTLKQLQIQLDEMIQNFTPLSGLQYPELATSISMVEGEEEDNTKYLSVPSSLSYI